MTATLLDQRRALLAAELGALGVTEAEREVAAAAAEAAIDTVRTLYPVLAVQDGIPSSRAPVLLHAIGAMVGAGLAYGADKQAGART